jgi:hypothetical protein
MITALIICSLVIGVFIIIVICMDFKEERMIREMLEEWEKDNGWKDEENDKPTEG